MNAQPTLMVNPGWVSKWDYKPAPRDAVSKAAEVRLGDITRVPMWLFVASNGARVLSRRPVEVMVQQMGPDEESPVSAFVFACHKLHVFASAATYKEAEEQFHEQVVHFFYTYAALPRDQVSEDAAEIQALYQAHFQESLPPVR